MTTQTVPMTRLDIYDQIRNSIKNAKELCVSLSDFDAAEELLTLEKRFHAAAQQEDQLVKTVSRITDSILIPMATRIADRINPATNGGCTEIMKTPAYWTELFQEDVARQIRSVLESTDNV